MVSLELAQKKFGEELQGPRSTVNDLYGRRHTDGRGRLGRREVLVTCSHD